MTAAPAPPEGTTRRRAVAYGGMALVATLFVYGLATQVAGVRQTSAALHPQHPAWLLLAGVAAVAALACYVAVFAGIVGARATPHAPKLSWGDSSRLAMAGQAATTVVHAGGAGALALFYWALGHDGIGRRERSVRLAAFLIALYSVYPLAILLGAAALWADAGGHRPGVALTVVPAVLATVTIVALPALALTPRAPALAGDAVRTALGILRRPGRNAGYLAAVVAYWGTNLVVLWATFMAAGVDPPVPVLVLGFFLGMLANLIPFLPGGAGSVDAGLVGALVALGEPAPQVVAAVLAYRLIAFWLPTPIEAGAYVGLMRRLRASEG